MVKNYQSFLLFLFLPLFILSQEYSYRQYTVQDGLVQSQVWPLFQDSKGYIWAGTKGGVSRFDGVSFLNFSHNDGLPGNFIHMITEDSRGIVWFLSMDGLAKFDGEKLTGFPTANFRNSTGFVMFCETAPGVMLIMHTSLENKAIFTEFRQDKYTDIPSPFPFNIVDPNNAPGYFALYDPANNYFLYASNSCGLIRIKRQDVDTLFKKIEKFQDMETGPHGRIYLIANDTVFIIVNDTVQHVFDVKQDDGGGSPVNFKIDKNGQIFYINLKNQLVIGENETMIIENFDFPVINTILIDREDNVWLGTETGLYRLITRAFVNFIPEKCDINEMIWSISEDKSGKIWFASYADGLQFYDGDQFTTERSYFSSEKGALYYFQMGSLIDHEGNILFPMNNVGGIKYDGQRFTPVFPGKVTLATFIFYEDPDNFDLFAGTIWGLYKISPEQKVEFMDIKPGNGKSKTVVSIVKDKKGRYWLGGFNGISLLDENLVIHLPTAELPFESGGNCMITDYRDNIWIGNTDGLFCYNFQSFEQVVHGGLNSMVTSLALVGDSALLVGSLYGLAILDLDAYYAAKKVNLVVLGKEEGFQGSETGQNAIFRDSKGYYWIACNDRVVRFEPGKLHKNLNPPSTFITGVSLLNERMEWINADDRRREETYLFSHEEKNLRFEFTGISTTAPEKVAFSYFLEGYDQGWSEPGRNRFAVYTNLPPGPYRLWLKSCNGDGIWSEEATSVSFQIVPAIYQRRIFWIICLSLAAVFFIFLGFAISNRRRHKQQEKLETEKKMAQLQLLTLKNQIDPHFTYNAINSVASAVLKEDKEQAYRFFVKFSGLIRSIMRSSDLLVRSLDEEIAFVTDYLEIQKFRFKNKFDYSIVVSDDINRDMLLPKTVIQTFAENALKHGILHLESGGRLAISVSKNVEGIIIEVEDNGIGRARAAELSAGSTGKGLAILRGYFDYYNLYNREKINFGIIDLLDAEGKASGTKVVIKIPDGFSFSEKE